jgi:undecaprenyl-diphosphatase
MKVGPLLIAAALAIFLATRWRRLQGENKVLGVIAVVGFAVYGSGLVHPPSLDKILKDVGQALGPYTYILVGAMAFLETGAFIGLVAPGETAVIVGGVVAGQGQIDIIVLIALVWACAVGGDSASFWLGRRLGRDFLIHHGQRVRITEERLKQVEQFLARHGGPTILVGRFIGFVRALAPFVAAASHMPYRRFIPYDVIAAGLWSAVFCLLGFVFWHSLDTVLDVAKKGALAFAVVVGVIVAAVALFRFLRVPENRVRVQRWLDDQAQRPALRPVVRVLAPVWRRVGVPAWRAAMPGLRFLWNRVTPGELGLEVTTMLAVVLVGWFVFAAIGAIVGRHDSLHMDSSGFDVVSSLHGAFGVDVAKVISGFGALPTISTLVGLASLYLLVRRRVAEALALAAGMALTVVGVEVSKEAFDRMRPTHPYVHTGSDSYPSGHAAYAMAYVAMAVAFWHAFRGVVRTSLVVAAAIVLCALVGLSRVYLRAHYLSDVLGGYGLAGGIFATCGTVALIVAFVRHNAQRA